MVHPFPVPGHLADSGLIGTLDIHNPSGKGFHPGKHFIGIEKEAAVKIFIFPYPEHFPAPALPVQPVEDVGLFFFVDIKLHAYFFQPAAAAPEGNAPAMGKVPFQLKGQLLVERAFLKKLYFGDAVQAQCVETPALFLVQAQIPPSCPGADHDLKGSLP